MPTTIDQFVPSYVQPGAIGTHVWEVRRTIEDMGLRARTFAGDWRGVPDRDVARWEDRRVAAGDTWLLYQLSIGHPMADALAAAPEPLLVNYHNITPEGLFRPWEPAVAPELRQGRRQLAELAARTRLGIAVSGYNEAELAAAGYPRTTTAPVLVDYERLAADEDDATARRLAALRRSGGSDWLFVGRIAPNKAQHRLVEALAVHRRLHDPDARLWLVGGTSAHRYETTLRRLVADLGLEGAVTLTGGVPQPVLVAHYRHADVFVSTSEHEGFGIPLVEAMFHGVPVVAVGTSGVTETVAGAGLLLPQPRPVPGRGRRRPAADEEPVRQPAPGTVATAVARVLADDPVRRALVAAGHRRAAELALPAARTRMRAALEEALGR